MVAFIAENFVPLLFCGPQVRPHDLGVRNGFWDISATIASVLGIQDWSRGKSLL